jgi:hydroxyacylglutathione hydrolase
VDTRPFRLFVQPVTQFQQNCCVIVCARSNRGAVVDPGGDMPLILAAIERSGATIDKILLTHGHIDHVGAAAQLRERLNLPIEGPHEADAPLLDRLDDIGRLYGVDGLRPFRPDRFLAEGETVDVGHLRFDLWHCPGHSPGSLVYVLRRLQVGEDGPRGMGFALVGDVLFKGSIGRTDLPGGSKTALITAIHQKLLPLGDDIEFLPGHGAMSTFGAERLNNPYLT